MNKIDVLNVVYLVILFAIVPVFFHNLYLGDDIYVIVSFFWSFISFQSYSFGPKIEFLVDDMCSFKKPSHQTIYVEGLSKGE